VARDVAEVWERLREGHHRPLELFRSIDKDRSGKIDAAEFGAALMSLGIGEASTAVVKAIIKSADPNGDGKLDYKELLVKLNEAPNDENDRGSGGGGGGGGGSSSNGSPKSAHDRLNAHAAAKAAKLKAARLEADKGAGSRTPRLATRKGQGAAASASGGEHPTSGGSRMYAEAQKREAKKKEAAERIATREADKRSTPKARSKSSAPGGSGGGGGSGSGSGGSRMFEEAARRQKKLDAKRQFEEDELKRRLKLSGGKLRGKGQDSGARLFEDASKRAAKAEAKKLEAAEQKRFAYLDQVTRDGRTMKEVLADQEARRVLLRGRKAGVGTGTGTGAGTGSPELGSPELGSQVPDDGHFQFLARAMADELDAEEEGTDGGLFPPPHHQNDGNTEPPNETSGSGGGGGGGGGGGEGIGSPGRSALVSTELKLSELESMSAALGAAMASPRPRGKGGGKGGKGGDSGDSSATAATSDGEGFAVSFEVTLKEQELSFFGPAERDAFAKATSSALGVDRRQVALASVAVGSVVVATVVSGLATQAAAEAKVVRSADVATALAAAGLGASDVSAPTVARAVPGDWAAMVALYEAENPTKVGEVDGLLRKYAGREADMWAALEKKYGAAAVAKARADPAHPAHPVVTPTMSHAAPLSGKREVSAAAVRSFLEGAGIGAHADALLR
jgi:hypothetical protein